MKNESYVRTAAEDFTVDVKDSWGNENSCMLQGLGMISKRNGEDKTKRIFHNLMTQIPYECNYAGIACFYELENGELEIKERIRMLMNKLYENIDSETDEMAFAFFTKYETKLGGKERYQQLMNCYKKAYEKEDINYAYYMTSVIEGIESIDQAVYEYYDGLKRLFKESIKRLDYDTLDINDKAFAAYSILKACRLNVLLKEKYYELGIKLYDEVMSSCDNTGINKGIVVMLIAEKGLH